MSLLDPDTLARDRHDRVPAVRLRVVEPRTPEDLAAVRRLLRAYADWLAVDLCFQGFERELAELPGCYAPPAGLLLIARVGGDVVGCVACARSSPACAR